MHEVALITEMLDIVARDASTRGFTKVTRINLVVGKVSGACPPQLEFCFYAVTGDGPIDGVSMFKDATLIIEEEDPVASCRDCGSTFSQEISRRAWFLLAPNVEAVISHWFREKTFGSVGTKAKATNR
ncbi:MAG TPA: hydrogenase maturation nickel metallochaperone HypA [Clostridia bacterium]|nr:hydrogenase maturation nickel metallochaperone HypA [Clostridia bacterium]